MATTQTTSGTVGQSRLSVIRYIEHATRRCGVLPNVITGEMLISAQENLGFILTDLSTSGLTGWTYKKQAQAFVVGQVRYPTLVGTYEIQNVLRRNATFNLGTDTPDGFYATYNTSSISIEAADIQLTSSGTFTFLVEYSFDGVVWFFAGQNTVSLTTGQRAIVDCDNTQPAPWWRIREATNAATFSTVYFLSALNEVPIGQLNKADYTNLPDKGISSTDPASYWLDMQLDQPTVVLWQAPSNAQRHLVVWGRRYVMDVGDFTNVLEVPQRYQDAIIFELATRIFLELPKEIVSQIPDSTNRYTILSGKAEAMMNKAMSRESDGSPLRLTPRIRNYTRC